VLRDCVERHLGKVPVVAIEERALSPRFTTGHPELAALYGQLNRFNPSSLSIPREAWGAAMRALNQTDTLLPTAALGGLRCPTLFVVGSEDPIVPVEVVRELSGLVPGGELFVIEGAAHSAYYEQPQAFNPRVLAFLREALGGEPARPPGH
jgi:pimeloyl-ACP methyl ester carboxylesterase